MNYYIDVIKTTKNNAAKKAPADIAEICEEMGMRSLKLPDIPYEKSVLYQKLWMIFVWSRYLLKIEQKLKNGDMLLYQHPMYGTQMLRVLIPRLKKKGVKLVALIHDLNIIRGAAEVSDDKNHSVSIQDNVILREFDKIICHNERMKEFLVNQGFEENKLICLEIFDYLCEENKKTDLDNNEQKKCVIAGNLLPDKSGYIYKLTEIISKGNSVKLCLYGNGYDAGIAYESPFVEYLGSVPPEVLPTVLDADYGIVWDGSECTTCTGATGEYLRYNNPHKTSLYLAAGMPVIVWSEAAISDFVLKNNVGIAINDLTDIENALNMISKTEYAKIKNNAQEISKKLRNGFYFKQALNKAVEK